MPDSKDVIDEKKDTDQVTFRALASEIIQRASLAAGLGKTFSGTRDIYTSLGYKKSLEFDDYYNCFSRQDIARRVVSAYPRDCWRKGFIISQDSAEETALEKEFSILSKKFKLDNILSRLDVLSGIGKYAVLFLGFSDSNKVSELVGKGADLLYLRVYMENNAEINTYDENKGSQRYGLPETYKLTTSNNNSVKSSQDFIVHHSRILHVAEDCEDNELFGTPRLKCVFNRLEDLEKIAGGSSEMFWRGAFPGYVFNLDSDASIAGQALTDIKDQIETYIHGLNRYMRLQGIKAEELEQQIADPKGNFEIIVDLISAATGIPKRILLGSERGELSSSQDRSEWDNRVMERQLNHIEPMIVRPFVNKLIEHSIISGEIDDYSVIWPPVGIPTEKEKAEISKIKTDSIVSYSNSMAPSVFPLKSYLEKILGLTNDEILEIENVLKQEISKEVIDIEEDISMSEGDEDEESD